MNQRGQKVFYVYILSSLSGTLYVGLTDDLRRRVQDDATNADSREKQIKKFRRAKKIALFASSNPKWVDLSDTFSWLRKDLLM